MSNHELNFENELPVEIKAIINKPVTAIFLCLIVCLCVTSVVCIWKLILNINSNDILIAFINTGLAIGFVRLLPSSYYIITFNLENFSYKRLFFEGTISYTDIKAVYRIRRHGRYNGDYHYLEVKLNSGRTLKFSLGSLYKPELELMEKLFRVRARKRYIDKKSIF